MPLGLAPGCAVCRCCRRVAVPAVVVLTAAVFAPSPRFGFVYDALIRILTDTYLFDPRHRLDAVTFRGLGQDVFDFNQPL